MFDAFDDDQIDAVAEVDVSSMSRPTKRARTAPQDANTDSSSSSSSSSSTTSNSSTTASVSSTLTTKLATDTDYTDSTTDSTLATTTTRKPLPIIVVLDDGTTEREDGKACKHEVALAPGMTHEQFEAQRKAGRPDVPPTPGK